MKLIKSWVEVEKYPQHDELTFYYVQENELGERFMTVTSPLNTYCTNIHKERANWDDLVVREQAYLQFEQPYQIAVIYSISKLVDEITVLHEQLNEIELDRVKKENKIKELEKVYDKYYDKGRV